MIGIRCDANSIIASGHMMRCLTIAKELVKQGESVTFFLADEESKSLFDKYVTGDDTHNLSETAAPTIAAVVLSSDWRNKEDELPAMEKELTERKIKSLLVDSYQVTPGYFERLKEILPVAYLDDLNEAAYPIDMLINYSGYYEVLGYEEAYKDTRGHNGKPTTLLLGLNYAPLREQFYADVEDMTTAMDSDECCADNHKSDGSDRQTGLNILLTSGGSDIQGMLLSTLNAAKMAGLVKDSNVDTTDQEVEGTTYAPEAETEITWHVVVGGLVQNADEIESFAATHKNITIHRAVTNMAQLMRTCDLAVCAAGTMLTECAAIGLPAIYFQVADNQKYNVEFWQKTGGMLFAGDASASAGEKAKTLDSITAHIKQLSENNQSLSEMKNALTGITDGRGAQRIAKALLTLN